MRRILLIALAASVSAFAPAPFQKHGRAEPHTAVGPAQMQGRWQVVSGELLDEYGVWCEDTVWGIVAVRVAGNEWTFLMQDVEHQDNNTRVRIDTSRKPAAIDLYLDWSGQDALWAVGLIERVGDVVRIVMVRSGSREDRPTQFSLSRGRELITLRRAR